MGTRTSVACLLLAALLGGCAAMGVSRLEPGKSSEADVRAVLGEPAKVYADAGGSRQLVFPSGPQGTQTYMAFLGADGRLERLEQALSEESLRRIEPGRTTAAQLERLVGPPWRTVAFPNLGQVAWDYVIQDTWGYTVDFSVMIDGKGIVAGVVHARRDGRTGDRVDR